MAVINLDRYEGLPVHLESLNDKKMNKVYTTR